MIVVATKRPPQFSRAVKATSLSAKLIFGDWTGEDFLNQRGLFVSTVSVASRQYDWIVNERVTATERGQIDDPDVRQMFIDAFRDWADLGEFLISRMEHFCKQGTILTPQRQYGGLRYRLDDARKSCQALRTKDGFEAASELAGLINSGKRLQRSDALRDLAKTVVQNHQPPDEADIDRWAAELAMEMATEKD